MQDDTTGKPTQGWLPLDCESDLGVYNLSAEAPAENMELMERIVAPSNVRTAYRRVKRNDGCPGVDGMTVLTRVKDLFPDISAAIGSRSAWVCWTEPTGLHRSSGKSCANREAARGFSAYRRYWTA